MTTEAYRVKCRSICTIARSEVRLHTKRLDSGNYHVTVGLYCREVCLIEKHAMTHFAFISETEERLAQAILNVLTDE